MRRILIILLVLGIIGGGVWYFFFRTNTSSSSPEGTSSFFPNTISGVLPNGVVGDATQAPPSDTPATTTTSRFTQLTNYPVAGYTIFSTSRAVVLPTTDPKQKPTTETVIDHVIRYVSRANGYVYEIKNDESATQISNLTIPNIYEASFVNEGKTAILRFLRGDDRTIATYGVPVPDENSDGTRTQQPGTYLSDNIASLAISPDKKSIGSVILGKNTSIIQTTTPVATKEITRSSFREWILSWPTAKTMYVQTKAAASVEGYLYSIDTSAPKMKRVLGNINGLTASVSPSGTYVLYSQSGDTSFTTNILNTKTAVTTALNLSLLPEKCTWTTTEDIICAGNSTLEESTYPDSWYAGLIRFSDRLYRINTKSNTIEILYDGAEQSFDMTHLSYDETNNLIYYIDKTTGILWRYK